MKTCGKGRGGDGHDNGVAALENHPPERRQVAPRIRDALMERLAEFVEIVLFEISNSMKPYPSIAHAYTSKLRPVIGFFEATNLDEASNRIPPTSHYSLVWFTVHVAGPQCFRSYPQVLHTLALRLREDMSTWYGLRFSTEIYVSKREKTVFHKYLQETRFVLTEISGDISEFTGIL